jgi:hypothetical protein
MTLTLEEAIQALETMALQYLEYDGYLDHRFMSAGEQCLEVLERAGKVTGSGRKYKFTKESEYYDADA